MSDRYSLVHCWLISGVTKIQGHPAIGILCLHFVTMAQQSCNRPGAFPDTFSGHFFQAVTGLFCRQGFVRLRGAGDVQNLVKVFLLRVALFLRITGMLSDLRLLVCFVFGGAAIVFGVFSFPALTSGGGGNASVVSQAEFEAVFNQELTYCLEKPKDINCQCFANKSGTILADKSPRVFGAVYADKQELARSQAERSC